jgi:hypothetical protein
MRQVALLFGAALLVIIMSAPAAASPEVTAAIAGDDCQVETSDLGTAIDHWRSGAEIPGSQLTVETSDLADIIAVWRSGAEVDQCGAGELVIEELHPDAQGSDQYNRNDEYVTFKNQGQGSLDLTNWTLSDASGKTFAFPDGFTLSSGAEVTVRSGQGTDTATDLYWDSNVPVWDNHRDTVRVKDDTGAIVIEQKYSP